MDGAKPSDAESVFGMPNPSDRINMSGYLWVKPSKKGRFKTWNKRYFVLDSDGLLSHYVKENSEESKGTCFLQQRTKILSSEFRDHCFEIRTPSQKKIVLATDNEDDKDRWINALRTACKNSPPRPIKVCLVGDDGDGKNELLKAFFRECGQLKLADKVCNTENLELNLEVTGEKVKLILCSVSSTDFPKLRVLNYVNANAFMLCYSASSISSFESIEKVWYPEVKSTPNACLFLVGIHQQKRNLSKVDRLVGEELGEFLGALSFFDVRIGDDADNGTTNNHSGKIDKARSQSVRAKKRNVSRLESSSNAGDESMAGDIDEDDMDSVCATPAETFLNILEATLEDVDASVAEDEGDSGGTDVADMQDFKLSTNATFMDFIKSKSRKLNSYMSSKTKMLKQIASKANIHKSSLGTTSASSTVTEGTGLDNSDWRGSKKKISTTKLDEDTIGTLVRLRAALKNLRPKKKKKPEKPKLEGDTSKAHFVDRTQTGSLVFLGEDFLVEH